MEPGRPQQHAFVANSEDCTRPMYYNKTNADLMGPPGAYPKAVSLNKEQQCQCAMVAGNTICSACRRNAVNENAWKHKNQHDLITADFGTNDNNNKSFKDDSRHIHAFHSRLSGKGTEADAVLSKSYWPQNKHAYVDNSISAVANFTQLHAKKPSPTNFAGHKNYDLEAGFHFGEPPALQQHGFRPTNSCCEDRWTCEEKYALKNEPYAHEKIVYAPLVSAKGSVNDINHSESLKMESMPCTTTMSQHIVHSANILAIKGQPSSPSYVHKCSPVFNNVHSSCHTNLYVPPPQFSSEKFNSINLQSNLPEELSPQAQEYSAFSSPLPRPVHLHTESVKHGASPMLANKACYHSPQESQDASCPMNHVTNHSGFYFTSSAKVETAAVRSPIMLEQTHVPPQYSKMSLPQQQSAAATTAHSLPQSVQLFVENCVKKKDDYETHGPRNRNLYVNPYNNIPSKSDKYCAEQLPSFGSQSVSCNSPRSYPKMSRVSSKSSNETDNTQPMYSSAYGGNAPSSYYHAKPNARYESNGLKLPSRALTATTTSPALPPLHHNNTCTSQPPHLASLHAEECQLQPQMVFGRHKSESNTSTRNVHVNVNSSSNALNTPLKTQVINRGGVLKFTQNSNAQSHSPSPLQTSQSTKKSQVIKPNYRELINHVYAMRNSTSEEELNLQIIKKTLHVDSAQTMRPHTSAVPAPLSGKATTDTLSNAVAMQYSQDLCMQPTNNVLTALPLPLPLSYTHHKRDLLNEKTADLHELRKEKATTFSFSPLDLSMRTIKTKADSTECNLQRGSFSSLVSCGDHRNATKYTLPRVDFTPNFSLHTDEPNDPNDTNMVVYREQKSMENMEQNRPYSCATNQPEISLLQHEKHFDAGSQTLQEVNTCQRQTFNALPCSSIVPPPTSVEMRKKIKQNFSENAKQVQQTRPSVVEANPYALPKFQKAQQLPVESSSIHLSKTPLIANNLSSDTSVRPISETNYKNLESDSIIGNISNVGHISNISHIGVNVGAANTLKLQSSSSFCERNPNFLGRKRHLHEYTRNQNREQNSKLPRYDHAPNCVVENKFSTGATAAEARVNVTAEKGMAAEETKTTNAFQIATDTLVCKQEVFSSVPLENAPMPPITVKTEPTVLNASRIRTKAELKGFTFNTADIDNLSLKEFKIKEEPTTPVAGGLQLGAPLDDCSHQDLLIDFNWSNACNNFVEQLLTTSSKKRAVKKSSKGFSDSSNTVASASAFVGNRSMAIGVCAPNTPTVFKDDATQIQQDTYGFAPELEPLNKATTYLKADANDSTMSTMSPLKSTSQESTYVPAVIQKKFNKFEREKIRQQQEKRIAARRQQESSSESENEVSRRLTERQKKPLKRGSKVRGLAAEKKHFSDCGSDSSTNQETPDSDRGKRAKKQLRLKSVQQNARSINDRNKKTDPNKSIVIMENRKECENINLNCRNKTKTAGRKEGSVIRPNDELRRNSRHRPEEEEEKGRASNKVQYTSARSIKDNNKLCTKQEKNNKIHQKIMSLNTMTRSKCKRELEIQLANSKVLRNDKIIRNSTTKIKRKYVRKFVSNIKQTLANGDKEQFMSTRLRSGIEKHAAPKQSPATASKTASKRAYKRKPSDGGALIATNQEPTADLLLEVYRYKRALKVPASLISIRAHPSNQRMPSSLSDFEQRVQEPLVASMQKPMISKNQILTTDKDTPKITSLKDTNIEEPRSIIDLLHSRMIMSNLRPLYPKVKAAKLNTSNSSLHSHSETSQTTESNSIGLGELLPTPKKGVTENSHDGKRRHFSIFDTKVLKTKTRTESKLQQKKEILREIFVGEERPASAPPEMIQPADSGEKMTYEQKYEQFLQQMNIVINEEKLHKFARTNTSASISSAILSKDDDPLNVKAKQVTDNTNALSFCSKSKCKPEDDRHAATAATTANRNCFRRRRPTKYLRRKGSSGFDYIRKKKKPSAASNNSLVPISMRAERSREQFYGKVKTESDVCREIQKWVLNKGVGQSAMHKAARLGYIDVIVYCIDRMGLNPDQKDNAGYTPLHEACTNGQLEISRVLLQYGANHSEAAHSGIRPLHEACENDNLEIVRMLLSYGADPLLATYSGQTPLMLASSTSMKELLNEHLLDVQALGAQRSPWRFNGPWEIFDESECGCDIFQGAPSMSFDGRLLNNLTSKQKRNSEFLPNGSTSLANNGVILNNTHHNSFDSFYGINNMHPKTASTFAFSEYLTDNSDSDGEVFEFEEADMLLPPLYLLKDEGMDKWVLLSDLCNLLKVKSKDTLLNKIYPSSSISTTHKSHMKELKMSDFLEKATCLQLLCAGEKINICASKVVLIKYNDNVRNLLGVKTILMKF